MRISPRLPLPERPRRPRSLDLAYRTNTSHRPNMRRRGVALLASLVAILLLALVAVTVQHQATSDVRRSRDEPIARRAQQAADAGAVDLLRRWGTIAHETLSVGGMIGPDTLHMTAARAVATTVRTSPTGFWTVSEGHAGDSAAHTMARRRVQAAYRLAIPDLVADAALTVRDSLSLAGGARITGTDTTLAAWGALCSATAPAAAVAMPDTMRLCDGWCGSGSGGGRVAGMPALVADSGAADTVRYRRFGGEDWASLARHATITLPPGAVVTPAPVVAGGACDRTAPGNWGEPGGSGPCAAFAPLVWARGDVELRGGMGQGLLLVDGDLTLSAGTRFAGVILVRDDVVSQGSGGTVFGAVLAEDARIAPGDHSRLDGATLIQRSRCATDLALSRSARLRRVRDRWWSPLR
jgi:hypothetical protein